MEVIHMGSIYGFKGGNYAGIVYAAWGHSADHHDGPGRQQNADDHTGSQGRRGKQI